MNESYQTAGIRPRSMITYSASTPGHPKQLRSRWGPLSLVHCLFLMLLVDLDWLGSLSALDLCHETIEIRYDEATSFTAHQTFRGQTSKYE